MIVAEKDVLYKEWFFFSHFEGDPVMPGVLQLDAILQLSGFFLMHSGFDGHGRALRTGKITFREQVRPHHKLVTYRIDFKKITEKPTPIAFAEAIAEVDGTVVRRSERHHGGTLLQLRLRIPMSRTRVAVTGFGLISSLGRGADENTSALRAGRSGIISRRPEWEDGKLRSQVSGRMDAEPLRELFDRKDNRFLCDSALAGRGRHARRDPTRRSDEGRKSKIRAAASSWAPAPERACPMPSRWANV